MLECAGRECAPENNKGTKSRTVEARISAVQMEIEKLTWKQNVDGNKANEFETRSNEFETRSASVEKSLAALSLQMEAVQADLSKLRGRQSSTESLEDAQMFLKHEIQNSQSKLEERMQQLEVSFAEQALPAPQDSSAVREHDSDNQTNINSETSSGLAELFAQVAEVQKWREKTDDRLVELEHYGKLATSDDDKVVAKDELADEGKDVDDIVIGPGHVDGEEAEQPIGESLWEVALLICLDAVSPACSFMLVIGTVLNVVIQFVFCAIVYANMMEGSIDDTTIDALHHWRGVVGHSMQYWDRVAKTTLVAQLCQEDQALKFSASQSAVYSSITSFLLPSNDIIQDLGLTFLDGRLLCVIALFLWLLFTGCDMVQNTNFLYAVIQQPRGHGHLILQEDGSYRMNMIGIGQVIAFLVFAFVPRFIMASLLAAIGVKFLARTEDVEELLLNALALTFVLDIDEIMYTALAPYRVKTIVDKLEPMRYTWRFPVGGGLWYVVLRTLAAVIAVIIFNATLLANHNESLKNARDALCGGEKNFVYVIDKASGIVNFASTMQFDHVYPSTYEKQAVLEITRKFADGDSSDVLMSLEVELKDAIRMYEGTTQTAAARLKCADLENFFYPAHLKNASFAVLTSLDPKIINCTTVPVEDCTPKENVNVRALCPNRCGCDDAWTGLFYGSSSYGCPGECESFYITSLNGVTPFWEVVSGCMDVPRDALMRDVGWQRYINETRAIATDSWCDDALDLGCGYVAECINKGFDMCKPNSGLVGRSARPWCPQTCKCSAGKEECPSACGCIFGAEYRDIWTWPEPTCTVIKNADSGILGSLSPSALPGWAAETWGSAQNLPTAINQGASHGDGGGDADGGGNGRDGDAGGNADADGSSVGDGDGSVGDGAGNSSATDGSKGG